MGDFLLEHSSKWRRQLKYLWPLLAYTLWEGIVLAQDLANGHLGAAETLPRSIEFGAEVVGLYLLLLISRFREAKNLPRWFPRWLRVEDQIELLGPIVTWVTVVVAVHAIGTPSQGFASYLNLESAVVTLGGFAYVIWLMRRNAPVADEDLYNEFKQGLDYFTTRFGDEFLRANDVRLELTTMTRFREQKAFFLKMMIGPLSLALYGDDRVETMLAGVKAALPTVNDDELCAQVLYQVFQGVGKKHFSAVLRVFVDAAERTFRDGPGKTALQAMLQSQEKGEPMADQLTRAFGVRLATSFIDEAKAQGLSLESESVAV